MIQGEEGIGSKMHTRLDYLGIATLMVIYAIGAFVWRHFYIRGMNVEAGFTIQTTLFAVYLLYRYYIGECEIADKYARYKIVMINHLEDFKDQKRLAAVLTLFFKDRWIDVAECDPRDHLTKTRDMVFDTSGGSNSGNMDPSKKNELYIWLRDVVGNKYGLGHWIRRALIECDPRKVTIFSVGRELNESKRLIERNGKGIVIDYTKDLTTGTGTLRIGQHSITWSSSDQSWSSSIHPFLERVLILDHPFDMITFERYSRYKTIAFRKPPGDWKHYSSFLNIAQDFLKSKGVDARIKYTSSRINEARDLILDTRNMGEDERVEATDWLGDALRSRYGQDVLIKRTLADYGPDQVVIIGTGNKTDEAKKAIEERDGIVLDIADIQTAINFSNQATELDPMSRRKFEAILDRALTN